MDTTTVTYSQLSEIIKRRRSIRTFNDKPIDIKTIRNIIETATHAPSNNNRQGWKFFILTGRSIINKISIEVDKKISDINSNSQMFDDVMVTYRKNFTVFKNAPVVIVCCFVKPAKFNFKVFKTDKENNHFTGELISLSLVIQNILLLAESMSIGTLVMTAPLVAAHEIKEIVKVPNKYSIGAFICMGNYDEKPAPPAHKDPEQIITIKGQED